LVVDVVVLSPQLARATVSKVPAMTGAVTRLDRRICFSASMCRLRSGHARPRLHGQHRRGKRRLSSRSDSGCQASAGLTEPQVDGRLRTPRTPALCALRQNSRRCHTRSETLQRAAQSEIAGGKGVSHTHAQRDVVRGPVTNTRDCDKRVDQFLTWRGAIKVNRAVAYRRGEVLYRGCPGRRETDPIQVGASERRRRWKRVAEAMPLDTRTRHTVTLDDPSHDRAGACDAHLLADDCAHSQL